MAGWEHPLYEVVRAQTDAELLQVCQARAALRAGAALSEAAGERGREQPDLASGFRWADASVWSLQLLYNWRRMASASGGTEPRAGRDPSDLSQAVPLPNPETLGRFDEDKHYYDCTFWSFSGRFHEFRIDVQ